MRMSDSHIILKNISENSIAESDNGKSWWKKKWVPTVRRSRWIRVTVANKFELSCNIDRSFHRAISLSLALSSSSWIYWNFMRYPDEVRLENFIDVRWVAGSYITREKEGGWIGFYFAARSLLHFPTFQRRLQRDVSVGRNGRMKSRRKATFRFMIMIIYIFCFTSVEIVFPFQTWNIYLLI